MDIRTSKNCPLLTCFVRFDFKNCFSPQRRPILAHQMFEKWSETEVLCAFLLQNVRFAAAACIFSTSELQKVLPNPQFFNILTCKCTFRHSGVPFFDIWTYKSAPNTSCFVHFHFRMCFSPQRRAIFRHLNFKKCSETRAFGHSGVQFLMSPLSSYLRTRRFDRPTFGLTRHTNHWKNTAFRDFSNIWRGCIFFLLTFALLHLLSADLTTLLCFSTVHIVGSFYLNFLRLFKSTPLDQKSFQQISGWKTWECFFILIHRQMSHHLRHEFWGCRRCRHDSGFYAGPGAYGGGDIQSWRGKLYLATKIQDNELKTAMIMSLHIVATYCIVYHSLSFYISRLRWSILYPVFSVYVRLTLGA